jgi:hypothetical protein
MVDMPLLKCLAPSIVLFIVLIILNANRLWLWLPEP